ncbi:hypothetical protein TNCT_565441 [Trichonephila clavata]|uniref:Uncharacterized protein n=1 Tax=Trichonephila clavata TaxID=2740835 RepID=A0A8X6L9B3_TRICU|nr:hypothetical protein TNCT_565441 [Trichonephila clavata]
MACFGIFKPSTPFNRVDVSMPHIGASCMVFYIPDSRGMSGKGSVVRWAPPLVDIVMSCSGVDKKLMLK